MYFRPGSIIEYNPVISHNVSVDGYVFTDDRIPKDLEIAAISEDGKNIVRYAKVESDGFFIIEKLTPGKYRLELVGEQKHAPAPKAIAIEPGQDWVSDANVYWYQLTGKPPETTKAPTTASTNPAVTQAANVTNAS